MVIRRVQLVRARQPYHLYKSAALGWVLTALSPSSLSVRWEGAVEITGSLSTRVF